MILWSSEFHIPWSLPSFTLGKYDFIWKYIGGEVLNRWCITHCPISQRFVQSAFRLLTFFAESKPSCTQRTIGSAVVITCESDFYKATWSQCTSFQVHSNNLFIYFNHTMLSVYIIRTSTIGCMCFTNGKRVLKNVWRPQNYVFFARGAYIFAWIYFVARRILFLSNCTLSNISTMTFTYDCKASNVRL